MERPNNPAIESATAAGAFFIMERMTTLTATLIEELVHCRQAGYVQQEEFVIWMLREQARIEAVVNPEMIKREGKPWRFGQPARLS